MKREKRRNNHGKLLFLDGIKRLEEIRIVSLPVYHLQVIYVPLRFLFKTLF